MAKETGPGGGGVGGEGRGRGSTSTCAPCPVPWAPGRLPEEVRSPSPPALHPLYVGGSFFLPRVLGHTPCPCCQPKY